MNKKYNQTDAERAQDRRLQKEDAAKQKEREGGGQQRWGGDRGSGSIEKDAHPEIKNPPDNGRRGDRR